MDIKRELLEQIEIMIKKLEMEYADEINIIGGVRAYMDSYNDYNNPLLGELHKAERLNKQLI